MTSQYELFFQQWQPLKIALLFILIVITIKNTVFNNPKVNNVKVILIEMSILQLL